MQEQERRVICNIEREGIISYSYVGDECKRGKTELAHIHEAAELFRQYGLPEPL